MDSWLHLVGTLSPISIKTLNCWPLPGCDHPDGPVYVLRWKLRSYTYVLCCVNNKRSLHDSASHCSHHLNSFCLNGNLFNSSNLKLEISTCFFCLILFYKSKKQIIYTTCKIIVSFYKVTSQGCFCMLFWLPKNHQSAHYPTGIQAFHSFSYVPNLLRCDRLGRWGRGTLERLCLRYCRGLESVDTPWKHESAGLQGSVLESDWWLEKHPVLELNMFSQHAESVCKSKHTCLVSDQKKGTLILDILHHSKPDKQFSKFSFSGNYKGMSFRFASNRYFSK